MKPMPMPRKYLDWQRKGLAPMEACVIEYRSLQSFGMHHVENVLRLEAYKQVASYVWRVIDDGPVLNGPCMAI